MIETRTGRQPFLLSSDKHQAISAGTAIETSCLNNHRSERRKIILQNWILNDKYIFLQSF